MNENTVMFLLTAYWRNIGEILGIWMLRQSSRFPNPFSSEQTWKDSLFFWV